MKDITEETIGDLFADEALKVEDFGLRTLEVRRYGACHPSEYQPCKHDDETCDLVHDIYRTADEARFTSSGEDHCDATCRNLWDIGGETEGIGGDYQNGGSFSYLGDDEWLSRRMYFAARWYMNRTEYAGFFSLAKKARRDFGNKDHE